MAEGVGSRATLFSEIVLCKVTQGRSDSLNVSGMWLGLLFIQQRKKKKKRFPFTFEI